MNEQKVTNSQKFFGTLLVVGVLLLVLATWVAFLFVIVHFLLKIW